MSATLALAAGVLLVPLSSPAATFRSIDSVSWSTRGLIAFSAGSLGGSRGVFVVRPDGRGLRRVHRSPIEAHWSPQGDVLAFGDSSGLFLARAGGGPPRRIRRGSSFMLAWSPGGSKLLYGTLDGTIWTIRRDGTGQTRVARTYNDGFDAAWSPDGRRVAIVDCRVPGSDPCSAGLWDIFVVTVGRPGRTRVTRTAGSVGCPAWAPGRRILYQRENEVYVTGPGRPSDRRLLRNAACGSWSPDGRLLAAVTERGAVVARADGSNPRFIGRLRRATTGGPAPSWSSDRRRFVFARPNGIFIARADGGALRRVL